MCVCVCVCVTMLGIRCVDVCVCRPQNLFVSFGAKLTQRT